MANKYMKNAQYDYHQGDANQNHNKMSPPTSEDGYYQKNKRQQMLARMWRN